MVGDSVVVLRASPMLNAMTIAIANGTKKWFSLLKWNLHSDASCKSRLTNSKFNCVHVISLSFTLKNFAPLTEG